MEKCKLFWENHERTKIALRGGIKYAKEDA